MERKLPNVYANPIDKKISNVQETFYGSDRYEHSKDMKQVIRKINEIFSSRNFVYKKDVEITTDQGVLLKTLVGKTEQSLLTMDGEVIPISKIIDIKIK